ncbi:MAG: glycosyltransferase family 4 protein [Bryobacteraceae bacterium]|nr:glycosyltransferase family 4 protein [Bryobacteraceae bacterium]
MNWFAPAGNSGVADYAKVLHAALPPVPGVSVFHVGNNPLHKTLYRRLLTRQDPKRVVILHDAVLHHFLLGTLTEAEYIEEFLYNYGEWHRNLAQDLWARRAQSGAHPEYFRYPMLRRAMEAAQLVIVHNPAAKRLAQEHGAKRVELVPHFIAQPDAPPAQDILAWRAEHGLAPQTCLFGVFGHLRESKRIPAIVRAFALQREDCALLIQGDWGSPALRESLEPSGPRMLRVGPVPERELTLLLSATDVGLNLRYPSAGESSGILARLMAAAKPTIVTRGEEVSHLPPGAVWPVSPGSGEPEELATAMAYLAQHPAARKAMGIAARHYAQSQCGVEVLARELAVLLSSV